MIPIPNTNTDTKSDVIRCNKKYISTTGEYKVAFSQWPSTAVARPQSNVCDRGGRSKNLALKACYLWPSDRKARNTAAVRMLLKQAGPRSRAKVTSKLWEWKERRSASMYSSPSRRCTSLISYVDHPHRWLTRWAQSNSRLVAVYLWLKLSLSVCFCLL